MTSFYELECPTTWAEVPDQFSFTSLQTIESCPRRWQLLRSTWGDHAQFPERPHPAALEGSIVHEAIELLVRALGRRGMPSIGSSLFREALEDVDFWGYFSQARTRWNEKLAAHPRSGPYFVLRTSPRELANRAIRLFREQYTALDAEPYTWDASMSPAGAGKDVMDLLRGHGALSEVQVEHPTSPFHGKIDLVELVEDTVQVVDFKTGKQKDEHELQLQMYAVLWWRRTGVRPSRLAVQYLNQRREFTVGETELLAAEAHLDASIAEARRLLADKPAEARPGKDCRYCAARARCGAGWRAYQASSLGRPIQGTVDVEVVVAARPSPCGFLAEVSGREVDVVFDAAVGQHLPSVAVGDCLRLLDAVARNEGKTFEIRPWTEVYGVRGEGPSSE